MKARTLWPDNPVFLEVGVKDGDIALGLRAEGYEKYLGVTRRRSQCDRLRAIHPELGEHLTSSPARKLVLNNNAEVLILSGREMRHVWSYHSVRHAKWVAWSAGWSAFSLLALIGCLIHLLTKRYTWPRVVTLRTPSGKPRHLFASRIRRRKVCRRNSLHFIPHQLGLAGVFRRFEEHGIRYVVLRWFDKLPNIAPTEDVDMLVDDDSLSRMIDILESLPGIQPCDLYSESGLPRSRYCGTPYYPRAVARRILDGAILHNSLCRAPNEWDYFHSLAYHAVYHKGTSSNLSRGQTGIRDRVRSDHDFEGLLGEMARRLGIDVEISLEGLHAYLQQSGWGPPPELLARLAVACSRSQWLSLLAGRLEPHIHDQGLAVFVLRQEAVTRGFQAQIVRMIGEQGFEILAERTLEPDEIEPAAARTRGGNWDEDGPFELSGGLPAAVVIAYDRQPLPMTAKQKRRFPNRTNARIFAKEKIRDAIIAQLPPDRSFNALHSSDHAAEAWHLIEELAPQHLEAVRARVRELRGSGTAGTPPARQAA